MKALRIVLIALAVVCALMFTMNRSKPVSTKLGIEASADSSDANQLRIRTRTRERCGRVCKLVADEFLEACLAEGGSPEECSEEMQDLLHVCLDDCGESAEGN